MATKKKTKKTPRRLPAIRDGINLVHAREIVPRQRIGEEFGREYESLKSFKRTKDAETLLRSIAFYRWWFQYLKLAIELEQHNHVFVEYQLPTGEARYGQKNPQRREIKEKVEVNRKRYEEWNLDEVLESDFNSWFSNHRDLFIEEPTVELFQDKKMIASQIRHIQGASHYRYFRVDSRKSITNTINEIKDHLSEEKTRRSKSTTRYEITGEGRQETLFNNYNALVLRLKGYTNPEILAMTHLFRQSRGKKIVKQTQSKIYKNTVVKHHQLNSQRMNNMTKPARRLVLTVADGHFMKNPRKKEYFKRRRK